MAPPNILLHGSGAIGTIYAYLLLRAGCTVTTVCRSNFDAATAQGGFTLESAKYGSNIPIRPTHIVRSPADAVSHGPFDYVIVCTKALPDTHTAKTIQPAVSKDRTTIVLIQNGIGIEKEYAELFPSNTLLSCVVYLPTTQDSPGHISMGNFEMLEIGTFPAEAYTSNDKAKQATDVFVKTAKQGGSDARFFSNIQEKRWSKLLINASWNPICALTLSRDVAFLSSTGIGGEGKTLVEAVMQEVVATAQALGHKAVTAQMAEDQLARATDRVGGEGIEPSMLVDALQGRRMEIEVILGEPVRTAKGLGLEVPRMETLYALGKALDEAIRWRKPGKSLGGKDARS